MLGEAAKVQLRANCCRSTRTISLVQSSLVYINFWDPSDVEAPLGASLPPFACAAHLQDRQMDLQNWPSVDNSTVKYHHRLSFQQAIQEFNIRSRVVRVRSDVDARLRLGYTER